MLVRRGPLGDHGDPELGAARVTAAYAVVFGVALLTTLSLTPLVRRLSFKRGILVPPSERRVHTQPTPLLGGAAILAGFLAGMGVAACSAPSTPCSREHRRRSASCSARS